ncbi:hypothetical protein O3G_MSEX005783 [Manduca sexta]|uniref:Zonadhesin n=1 Tax=Manduca sexta TaxID=7130 RepID=A0A922CJ89_MANSE|nr:hypothetical protein O3G_MSEX005783 [Manduca sexta]
MLEFKTLRCVFALLCCVTYVSCDKCVTYKFQEDFEELFNKDLGVCANINLFWLQRSYASIDLQSPNEKSVSFITPQAALSCVSSFFFTMTGGGTVEVNIYMDGAENSDQITVFANQYVPNGNDAVMGTISNTPLLAGFVRGWQSLRVTILGSATYTGYITLMGTASPDSIVLVDSFRYIPPGYDEERCVIYEEDKDPATTEIEIDSTTGANVDETTEPGSDPTTQAEPVLTTETQANVTEITTEVEPSTADVKPIEPETTSRDGGDSDTTTQPSVEEITTPSSDIPTIPEPEPDIPTTPEPDTPAPEPDIPTTPEPDTPAPEPHIPTTPEPDTPAPEPDIPTTPEPDTPAPEPGIPTTPESDTPAPEPSIPTTPEPDTSAPEPDIPTTPEPDTPAPEPGIPTTPEPDTPAPEPDTPAPEPGIPTTPEPDTPAPEPDIPTTPEPDTPMTPPPNVFTTQPDINFETTESYTTTTEENYTDSPEIGQSSFWTPLTITMVVLLCFIILVIVAVTFYEIGKRRSVRNEIMDIDIDIDNLPKTITVPRVKQVYTDPPYSTSNAYLV